MGIGAVELNLLRLANLELGDVLTIGRQEYGLGWRSNWEGYAEDYLMKIGATSVTALDFSSYEGKVLQVDLSVINKKNLCFDTILDFGSLEHVSNPLNAISNFLNLLKPAGVILHSNPANGSLGHGFFQFSPEFYQCVYGASNCMESIQTYLVDRSKPKVFYLVKPVQLGKRANIRFNPSNIYNVVIFKKNKNKAFVKLGNFQQQDYLGRWKSKKLKRIQIRRSNAKNMLLKFKILYVDKRNLSQSKLNGKNPSLTRIKLKNF